MPHVSGRLDRFAQTALHGVDRLEVTRVVART